MRKHDEPERDRRTTANPRRVARSVGNHQADESVSTDPARLAPAALLALQRAIGNAAVARMMADRQQSGDTDQTVQRSAVHEVLRSSGRPLDEPTRTEMEARLGTDFSDVRLHTGPAAQRSATEIGARAYTSGSHVVIGAGGGDKHTLAHELTHVIQQRRGPVSGTDLGSGLSVSEPGDRFEREAEANARAALRGPVQSAPDIQRTAKEAITGPTHEDDRPGPAAVQRLKVQGWAVVSLKNRDDAFLLDLVRALSATTPPPNIYTNNGVTYDVQATDLATAKKLLSDRQQDLMKKSGTRSPYADYDAYATKMTSWRDKHDKRAAASLTTGSYLYHGTSKQVALLVKAAGLSPAQPSFRGGVWDASKDGFLSMATTLRGVTVTADSVILRMKVEENDTEIWQWKKAGGADEVVTLTGIPADRLEWSTDKKEWKPMGELV